MVLLKKKYEYRYCFFRRLQKTKRWKEGKFIFKKDNPSKGAAIRINTIFLSVL